MLRKPDTKLRTFRGDSESPRALLFGQRVRSATVEPRDDEHRLHGRKTGDARHHRRPGQRSLASVHRSCGGSPSVTAFRFLLFLASSLVFRTSAAAEPTRRLCCSRPFLVCSASPNEREKNLGHLDRSLSVAVAGSFLSFILARRSRRRPCGLSTRFLFPNESLTKITFTNTWESSVLTSPRGISRGS